MPKTCTINDYLFSSTICNIPVYALDLCSRPYGEGYRQSRIRYSCNTQNNVPQIIESRALEGWRGLVTDPTKPQIG